MSSIVYEDISLAVCKNAHKDSKDLFESNLVFSHCLLLCHNSHVAEFILPLSEHQLPFISAAFHDWLFQLCRTIPDHHDSNKHNGNSNDCQDQLHWWSYYQLAFSFFVNLLSCHYGVIVTVLPGSYCYCRNAWSCFYRSCIVYANNNTLCHNRLPKMWVLLMRVFFFFFWLQSLKGWESIHFTPSFFLHLDNSLSLIQICIHVHAQRQSISIHSLTVIPTTVRSVFYICNTQRTLHYLMKPHVYAGTGLKHFLFILLHYQYNNSIAMAYGKFYTIIN